MQDFTGVPCIVDLATMREAVADLGGDPKRVNPLAPAEMVIDHSVQIDAFGNSGALERNMEIEYQRNGERYQFLRWGQTAFDDFKVVPPGMGIVHQVNIEYLARTVAIFPIDDVTLDYLRLTGRSEENVALVEAYAKEQGLWHDPSNEVKYSEYLELDLSTVVSSIAGPKRPQDRVELTNAKAQFRDDLKNYVTHVDEDVTAGNTADDASAQSFPASDAPAFDATGEQSEKDQPREDHVHVVNGRASNSVPVTMPDGRSFELDHGAVTIASITSCTNTSNPSVMMAAAVLARNAVDKGLASKPWVKTSVAPGSKVVTDYYEKSGLIPYLEKLGFFVVGYGCAERWQSLPTPEGATFEWDAESTYVRKPPYFEGMKAQPEPVSDIEGARVLLKLGDSVTTDHISPAGSFKSDTPAGKYLLEHGVARKDFNSYGSRRGNHEVMIRGTFANIRIKNQLLDGVEGGFTRDFSQPDAPQAAVYDAAMNYQEAGTPLVVLAGKEYGSGSSRDWAAKGTALLGVKAVIAESYERIHRSNLIGMGVLPLQYPAGVNAESLGLTGTETFSVEGVTELNNGTTPETVKVTATPENGEAITFDAVLRIDTPGEADYYRNGGILQYVLRQISAK